MAKATQDSAQATQDSTQELIKLEYQLGLDGYKYRDQLVPQEFAYMLQAFFVYSAAIATSQTLVSVSHILAFFVSLTIGIIGLVTLLAYVVDIEANTSCKGALRAWSEKLEKELKGADDKSGYWYIINERDMFLLEKIFGSKKFGVAAGFLVMAARLILALWVFVAVAATVWGQTILPRS